MSYKSMLRHRCSVLRLQETMVNGIPVYDWSTVATGVRCFVDLNFVRMGKDPTWTPEAGRSSSRAGVGFFMGLAPVKNGDQIIMTQGPSGRFALEAAVDEAWTPSAKHHLEVSVKEVAGQLNATGESSEVGR